MIKCREVAFEEIEKIYHRYMVYDFPENERKPLASMERMYQQGEYKGFVMEEEDAIIAYWMLLQDSENQSFLLDYFAVMKELRGQGYGSRALTSILDSVGEKDIVIIEAENPKKALNRQERELQEKRLEFYRKNGVRFTGLASVVYDASYVIMYLSGGGQELPEEEVYRMYVDFYEKWILGKEKCKKHFIMEEC